MTGEDRSRNIVVLSCECVTGEGCCRKIVVISIKRRLQSKNRSHIDQKTIVVEMSKFLITKIDQMTTKSKKK